MGWFRRINPDVDRVSTLPLPSYNINSPRGAGVDGEDADWDFGTGAGFYLDATEEKWAKHYRMYSYITEVGRSVGQ